MKPLLIFTFSTLLFSFITCQTSCSEDETFNPSPKVCHAKVTGTRKEDKTCCHVSLRASGQYHSFCYQINHNGQGSKIKDVEKDLNKWYDKVKIDCSSYLIKSSLYIAIFSLFAIVAF